MRKGHSKMVSSILPELTQMNHNSIGVVGQPQESYLTQFSFKCVFEFRIYFPKNFQKLWCWEELAKLTDAPWPILGSEDYPWLFPSRRRHQSGWGEI